MMTFKTHLVAISSIILVVFSVWLLSQRTPVTDKKNKVEQKSPYQIIIVRASWGLNCLDRDSSADNVFEDNVKKTVTELCEGKKACRLPVNETVLKINLPKDCNEKWLDIEYRCFTFDRLRTERAAFGNIDISCQDTGLAPVNPNAQ